MKLKDLDGRNHPNGETWDTHRSIIQQAQQSLLEIWSGEYDDQDTIAVLRHAAQRLCTLATLIARNQNLDDEHDNNCESD